MKQSLPGELPYSEKIARMIRVNHAGEYGAQRIYEGQLAVLGKSPCGDVLRHMAQQEQEHLDCFSDMLVERSVRPTALMPLWNVAGFALGAATALMGEKVAMACTVAVETVIDEHYAAQEIELGDDEKELKQAISKFRLEEQEHRDTGLAHGAEESPLYSVVTGAIKLNTRLAIWLATRV
ncbi:MAG: demethoxyubiquinone hydroxylase family protein [Rickettsiales bacterium]|jgi:ubiquinone biosynthesis monooxygenase Coq7